MSILPALIAHDLHLCVLDHHRWLAIEDAISEQGWSLVLLLRAAPFVPCCVLNYTLSLTSVRCSSWVVLMSCLSRTCG